MFSHKAFLKLGDFTGTDFMSLVKSGYELLHCEYSFKKGVDDTGKVCTEVFGGAISLTLPMLPPNPILEWALNTYKYKKGMIVILDEANIPSEKIIFDNAACISLSLDYTQKGESYIFSKILLQAERIIVGNDIEFDNNWIK